MTAERSLPREPVVARFAITPADAADAARAYIGNSMRPHIAIAAASAVLFAGIYLVSSNSLSLVGIGVAMLVAALAASVPFLEGLFARVNPQARLGTEIEYRFTDAALGVSNAGITGTIDWAALTDWREGDAAILLFSDRAVLAAIPKRAFNATSDLDAARATIANNVARSATPRRRDMRWLVAVAVVPVLVFVVAFLTAYLQP